MSNSPPSVNPANLDNVTGAFKEIFKKLMQGIDGMLPAQVIAFDRSANRVQVQPLIVTVGTSGSIETRAQIASIPVLQLGGGNFMLNFNLVVGDLGWILANDRDISLFLQNYNNAIPNTHRMKSFSDAVFIPNIFKNYTIAEEDVNNAVLQSLDGAVKISLGSDKIKISAPTVEIVSDEAHIDSPIININSSGGVQVTTPVLAVQGNITATGTITPGV